MSTTVVENCAVATVDAHDTVHASGHVVITDGWITAVGAGPAPDTRRGRPGRRQRLPRHAGAGQHPSPLLPMAHARPRAAEHVVRVARRALPGVGAPRRRPRARSRERRPERAGAVRVHQRDGPPLRRAARRRRPVRRRDRRRAARSGCASTRHAARWTSAKSGGGLPPDSVVEDVDTILSSSEDLVAQHHDPAPDSMLRIALAPCSPFSVTADLMRRSAELARRLGVRLHTHLAETEDEEEFCLEQFGQRPVDYLDSLGYLGDDVWLAHCVHLSDADIARFGATGTGVAHCPSSNARLGAGIARVPELLAAGVPVGLGVDGVASNEAGRLGIELRQALLVARARGGPRALTAAQSLRLGHDGRRAVPRTGRRAGVARGRQARRRRAVATRSRTTIWGTSTSPIRCARWCSGRSRPSTPCWSAARRWCATASCAPPTSPASRASCGRRRGCAADPDERRRRSGAWRAEGSR